MQSSRSPLGGEGSNTISRASSKRYAFKVRGNGLNVEYRDSGDKACSESRRGVNRGSMFSSCRRQASEFQMLGEFLIQSGLGRRKKCATESGEMGREVE